MKRKQLLTYALGLLIGITGGITIESRNVDKLEDKLRLQRIQCLSRHEKLLSQLPNYDAFGSWLDGQSYEDWMIRDINERYKRMN